jgi:hypothetical protein
LAATGCQFTSGQSECARGREDKRMGLFCHPRGNIDGEEKMSGGKPHTGTVEPRPVPRWHVDALIREPTTRLVHSSRYHCRGLFRGPKGIATDPMTVGLSSALHLAKWQLDHTSTASLPSIVRRANQNACCFSGAARRDVRLSGEVFQRLGAHRPYW